MSKKEYFLVIDAGTGSARAVVFDTKGTQVGIAQKEWTHKAEDGVPNSMGFECDKNWKLICECIRGAIADAKIDAKDIVALSSSSMREGIVLYDKDKNELWAVANVDGRASKEVEELKRLDKKLEAEFYKKSGQTYALGALPRLLWVKKNAPKIYEKTAYINMLSDWVLFKLSSELVSEPSNAGTSGVFDLKKRNWAPDMAQKVGLKDDIFPVCLESGTVVGYITKKAASECGLNEGTLVVLGGGDVQLGCAGLGVVHENECAILGGSFWQQIINLKSTKTDKAMRIRINPHVIEGLVQAEAISFFTGLVMRWFRDGFCDGVSYEKLEMMASSVPVGSYGIMPIFSDVMNYGKWYHAAPSLINLSIDPALCNRASVFRALQENAAIVSALNLEAIRDFSGVSPEMITFAGGASKGRLWSQILSDATGLPLKIPVVTEATSLGAAMAAGVGAGIYSSISEAATNLVKWEREHTPNMENHKIYKELKQRWQEAYKAQLKLVDKGLTSPMWRAPGA